MPLMKSRSKDAFSHNVAAEMDAGRPQKQALAIAYATKRAAKKSAGGMVKRIEDDSVDHDEQEHLIDQEENPDIMAMARGGMMNPKLMAAHEKASPHMAIVHAILSKKDGYADGGMIEEEEYEKSAHPLLSADAGEGLPMSEGGIVPDFEEDSESMDHDMGGMEEEHDRKKMLSGILSRVRMMHTGRR